MTKSLEHNSDHSSELKINLASTPNASPAPVAHILQESSAGIAYVTNNVLAAENRQLDAQVKERLSQRIQAVKEKDLPQLEDYPLIQLEKELKAIIRECGYECSDIPIAPPASNVKNIKGIDLAFNAASLAKNAGKKIPEVVADITEALQGHSLVREVQTAGPFVNISLAMDRIAQSVINSVIEQNNTYGHYNEGQGKPILIDYSGPNIAKSMTVAHLRSTIIGHSLSKIYEAAGYTGFRINHLGDWGTQFGKIIYQYKKELAEHGDEFLQRLEEDPAAVLLEIYRDFVFVEKENPEAMEAARLYFLKLEQADPELVALWHKCRQWSFEEFEPVYRRLQIDFDAIQGESFFEDRMTPIIEEALTKGVLQRNEDGTVIYPGQTLIDPVTKKRNEKIMHARKEEGEEDTDEIRWKDEVILKPSGGSVYLTRDLAAIRYRTQELKGQKILYVIGKEQQRHCAILMNIAAQMDWNSIGDSQHLSFGHMTVNKAKMSSRTGTVFLLNDILNAAIGAAKSMLLERKQQTDKDAVLTSEDDEVARKIGTGSVIYNDLKQDREKDIEFSPDIARSMESGGCPYIQYTYCRLKSISEKIGSLEKLETLPAEMSAEERGLILDIAAFPKAIKEATASNAPHKIANYADQFSQRINNFYHSHDIARADDETKAFRLSLVEASQQVLINAMELLHIELPDHM